jgi:hypothetical protein
VKFQLDLQAEAPATGSMALKIFPLAQRRHFPSIFSLFLHRLYDRSTKITEESLEDDRDALENTPECVANICSFLT